MRERATFGHLWIFLMISLIAIILREEIVEGLWALIGDFFGFKRLKFSSLVHVWARSLCGQISLLNCVDFVEGLGLISLAAITYHQMSRLRGSRLISVSIHDQTSSCSWACKQVLWLLIISNISIGFTNIGLALIDIPTNIGITDSIDVTVHVGRFGSSCTSRYDIDIIASIVNSYGSRTALKAPW